MEKKAKIPFVFVREKPNIVELEDDKEVFGEVEEITSRDVGAEQVNVTKITLWGSDSIHKHREAEETYYCLEGDGELFLDGQISKFSPGMRVIIKPGTLHAARPKPLEKLVFLCVSSPAFNPIDVWEDDRGRVW